MDGAKGLCNKSLSFSKRSIETLKIDPFSEKNQKVHTPVSKKKDTQISLGSSEQVSLNELSMFFPAS